MICYSLKHHYCVVRWITMEMYLHGDRNVELECSTLFIKELEDAASIIPNFIQNVAETELRHAGVHTW